jgi:hypothetical protein
MKAFGIIVKLYYGRGGFYREIVPETFDSPSQAFDFIRTLREKDRNLGGVKRQYKTTPTDTPLYRTLKRRFEEQAREIKIGDYPLTTSNP